MTTLNGGSRPAVRPRLLALVRKQLSAVKHHIGELQVLQRELEQMLERPLASAHERRAEGCRCLDIVSARDRSAPAPAAATTVAGRDW
jgi:hypothetical protein